MVGEHIEQVLGQFRLQQTVVQRPVRGRTGHGDISGDALRRMPAQLRDMGGDGAGVTPCDRAGQRRVTGPQRVVQGGAEQRPQHPVRGLHARVMEQLHRLGHERDQVVCADGERRVVERTG